MAKAKIPPEVLAFFVKAGRKGGKIGGKARVAKMTPEQLSEWRNAAEPLREKWADSVRKAGYDPVVVMNDLKAALAQYNSAY